MRSNNLILINLISVISEIRVSKVQRSMSKVQGSSMEPYNLRRGGLSKLKTQNSELFFITQNSKLITFQTSFYRTLYHGS